VSITPLLTSYLSYLYVSFVVDEAGFSESSIGFWGYGTGVGSTGSDGFFIGFLGFAAGYSGVVGFLGFLGGTGFY
jgi:hypothetical protein